MKYLTPIADGIDARLQDIEDDIWQYIRKTSIEDQSSLAVPKVMGSIAGGMAFKGLRFVADAFAIDLLRIGDGIEKAQAGNKWGYVEDGARALVIGGAVLKLIGRAAGGARAVHGVAISADVASGLPQCAFVAAARAARFQGVYVTAADLAAELGVPLKSLGGVNNINEVLPALKQIGVAVNEITLPAKGTWNIHRLTTWADIERVLGSTLGSMGANGDVCMIAVAGPGFGAHALLVRRVANGIQFIDRSGMKVARLSELERIYPGIGQTTPVANVLHFPDTRIAEAARMAASPEVLYAMIAVRVLPALVESGVLSATPPRRAVPPELQKARDQGALPSGRMCLAPKPNSPLPVLNLFRYVVQVGDSLAKLAQRIYRDESQWKLILDINRAVFGGNVKPNDSLDILAVGRVELFIPSTI